MVCGETTILSLKIMRTYDHQRGHLISVSPIAVTMIVEGTPNMRWPQKDKVYSSPEARRACSHTIKLAADPRSERFPPTVLAHAKISHDFFTSADEMAAADAATRPPSNRTGKRIRKKQDHYGKNCYPARVVNLGVWFHEIPKFARYPGPVKPIHRDEHPAKEDQQKVGDLQGGHQMPWVHFILGIANNQR
ncbi:hypothetical protein SAY87_009906 [Trapa incisa]|uniref:Uncharacterized protein n=1 Tax=Trapa incisa TaxID=236973 RepID=A0AAN7GTB5_9MYRT|nr:hypothetical protein SAY87_009906 [Trapa incisa]